jgi:hypothetical protein
MGVLSRSAAALSLGVLLLSGCSGGSEPGPSTLPTLSPTPTPSATLAPIPPAATALTPQGADAFVRYFFDQMNIAFRTSNASLIGSLSTPACFTCQNYVVSLRDRKRNGQFYVADTFAVTDVAAAPPEGTRTSVDVIGTLPARNSVDAQGRILEHFPAKARFYFVAKLERASNAWTVVDLSNGDR